MSTLEEQIADSIAREDSLRAYLAECNDARLKLQNEVEEQEQEIADLNKYIAILKTPAFTDPAKKPSDGIWSRIGNWIKRLAK